MSDQVEPVVTQDCQDLCCNHDHDQINEDLSLHNESDHEILNDGEVEQDHEPNEDELSEPGDVEIDQPDVDMAQLQQYLRMLEQVPADKRNELLNSLGVADTINPMGNNYEELSESEMRKRKLQQKKRMFQMQRDGKKVLKRKQKIAAKRGGKPLKKRGGSAKKLPESVRRKIQAAKDAQKNS